MVKLASAGAKVTVEKVEKKEEKPGKEEEKQESSRSSRAIPYVAPPSVSSDVMKIEMGKTIVLPSLEDKHIKLWGTKVQGFETSYGRYDRNRISVEVRERINLRWVLSLYIDSLPERLRASREEGKENNNWTWLNHDVISSEELTSFLLATVNSGTGHDVGDQKHKLVNQWIKTQTLSFTIEGLQISWEDFILGWEKTMTLHIPNVHELTPAHHKGMIEELKSMVSRSASRKDTIPHLAMAFLLPFQNKVQKQVDILIKDLSEAFTGVMKNVVKNQLFNTGLFKSIMEKNEKKHTEGEKGKDKGGDKGKDKTKPFDRGNDKRKENPNSQSSSSSKSSKTSHADKRVAQYPLPRMWCL